MPDLYLTHDRDPDSEYFNFDNAQDGIRTQIVFLQDEKAQTRTVEAIWAGKADDPEGDQWHADMETVCALLPPTVTLMQFLYAVAKTLQLGVSDPDSDEDDRPDVWKPIILRQIVDALVTKQ